MRLSFVLFSERRDFVVTATSFIYDGISSEDYDLMIYYIGDPGVVEETVWEANVEEERIPCRQDALMYGISSNSPLTFEMTVGSRQYIDRETAEEILDWLTSHNTYKWLEFEQDDMTEWRYKALINNIQMASVNGMPFAFKCTVVCDSQFAYEHPTQFSYEIVNGKVLTPTGETIERTELHNNSSFQGYYYPKMEMKITSSKFAIVNHSDNGRRFDISIPDEYATNDSSPSPIINVDNKNQIITCNSDNVNIYKLFGDEAGNHYFFRLVKGQNELSFEGDGLITFNCEFIRKVGR